MLSKNNLNALKCEVKNVLMKRSQIHKKVTYEELIATLNKEHDFFTKINVVRLGESIRAHDILLKVDEVYVQSNYMITVTDGALKIYKYNHKYKFSKIREMNSHLLLFFLKTANYDGPTRQTLYNIVLTFVEQEINRLEKLLEDTLLYLDINNLESSEIKNDELICNYKNGKIIIYNTKLVKTEERFGFSSNVISNSSDDEVLRIENDLETITVKQDFISIDHKNKSFISLINFKGVKQASYYGTDLFLLCEDKICVLTFETLDDT